MIPYAALQDLIKNLTNQTPTLWEDEPEPFLSVKDGRPGRYFKIDVVSYRSKGADEYRSDSGTTPATANTLYSSINGVRYFILTVKGFSFDRKMPALEMLEQLRLRLWSVSARSIYAREGLALADLPGPIVKLPLVVDSRATSCATMDLKFGFASVENALDDAGGTIATAGVTGKLT